MKLNLKRAGRWKDLATAEEYLEHSAPVLADQMRRLENRGGIKNWDEDGHQILEMVKVIKFSLNPI